MTDWARLARKGVGVHLGRLWLRATNSRLIAPERYPNDWSHQPEIEGRQLFPGLG